MNFCGKSTGGREDRPIAWTLKGNRDDDDDMMMMMMIMTTTTLTTTTTKTTITMTTKNKKVGIYFITKRYLITINIY